MGGVCRRPSSLETNIAQDSSNIAGDFEPHRRKSAR